MNCLLHVPNSDLPGVLAAIRAIMRPGGLFFLGVYGGDRSVEGPIDNDEHVPPRFFSWRTDDHLLGFAADARFDIVDFHPVDTGRGFRFQSLTLRRPKPDRKAVRHPDREPDRKADREPDRKAHREPDQKAHRKPDQKAHREPDQKAHRKPRPEGPPQATG